MSLYNILSLVMYKAHLIWPYSLDIYYLHFGGYYSFIPTLHYSLQRCTVDKIKSNNEIANGLVDALAMLLNHIVASSKILSSFKIYLL